MLCDPLYQIWVHRDFLVLTSTAESLFEKSGFYQNEAKMPEKRLRISQTVMLKRAFGKSLFQ